MDYIKLFKEELAKQDRSYNTTSNYIRTLNDYAKFINDRTGEDFKAEEIIELDIKEYWTVNTKLDNFFKVM